MNTGFPDDDLQGVIWTSKYSENQINQALDEIAEAKEASEKLLHDICKVVAEHIRTWLERTEKSQNRVNGIILKK